MTADILAPPPAFVALDLSLTSTGVATTDGVQTIAVKMPAKASDLERVVRLYELCERIEALLEGATLVVIESPSYGSENSHAHSTGELHGVVKLMAYQLGIPFALVPPHCLRLYAIGKGAGKGATKHAVFEAAIKRSQGSFANFDEADAWWLLQMAYCKYGHPWRILMPQAHERGLDGVQWPAL